MSLEPKVPDEQTVASRQSPELLSRILVVEDDRIGPKDSKAPV